MPTLIVEKGTGPYFYLPKLESAAGDRADGGVEAGGIATAGENADSHDA